MTKYISTQGILSFKKVGIGTKLKVATKMRKEIVTFFKENPKKRLTLDFGGYTRLFDGFSDELFKKLVTDPDFKWKKYADSIGYTQMHIFDQQAIGESIAKGCKEMGYS